MEERVQTLEKNMVEVKERLAVAESDIKNVKEDISSIKDDTTWLRRAITNAFIVATISGVVAFLFTAIKGGV
ncbi:hemolysin activation protein [Bacillaceae bacterium SAOS 7]|nr:hemolysin activation protein [Bacillaceae bacterium SAOS 7]